MVFSIVSQVAAMSYSYKPGGKYMLLKPSQKFFMAKGHRLLLFSICIIFVSEADGAVGYLLYTVSGYRSFVRIPSKVFQYLCRLVKWSIGMYVPSDF